MESPNGRSLADLANFPQASTAEYRGVETVAAYASKLAELEALKSSCGVIDRGWVDLVEMRGEDRQRFLHGLVTCDIEALEPGQGVYGFVTSQKGRVLADLEVLCLQDRLWLALPRGFGREITEHLSKYVIADRVELAAAPAWRAIDLIGPRAEELLHECLPDGLPSSARAHHTAELWGHSITLARDAPYGWTLWVPADIASEFFARLLVAGESQGLLPVGWHAFDAYRIEQGRPLFGVDFGAEHFPHETGLVDEAVSFTKGCYLGQEVIARIHYRGGVNRHLRGLILSSSVDEAVGCAVNAGEREAGAVTSFAVGRPGVPALALAVLHRRAAEPGTRVRVGDEARAEVVELPFAIVD